MIPKFRAWDKHNKKMFTNEELIIWNDNVYANDRCKLSVDKLKGWSISDKFLMQSTGLADKNGVEIFEGDIVKTTRFFGRADETGGFYEYDKKIMGVVKQLEGAWVIDTGSEAVNLWTEIEENSVIGNVWEDGGLIDN